MIDHFNKLNCSEFDVYIQFVKVPELLGDYLSLDTQHLFQPPAIKKNTKGFLRSEPFMTILHVLL